MMGPERTEIPVTRAMRKAAKTAPRAALGKGAEDILYEIMTAAKAGFMRYENPVVDVSTGPHAVEAAFQHVVETYASETNKTAATWRQFSDEDLNWKPHAKSASVGDILRHQILSERRFFSEFLGHAEPAAATVLPEQMTVEALSKRFVQLAVARLPWLASLSQEQWAERWKFFDEERERIWIFWRRVLHSAHHRTQLTVYLRLLDKPVPSTYGPTADVTWAGASPTLTVG
jgi:uncharacterized damage-inducible protein DinB